MSRVQPLPAWAKRRPGRLGQVAGVAAALGALRWAGEERMKERAGLVLTGGGARAAYQVGALRALAEIAPAGPVPFEVLAGISAGAINAVVVAAAADFRGGMARLAETWRTLTPDRVFSTGAIKLAATGGRWIRDLSAWRTSSRGAGGGAGQRGPFTIGTPGAGDSTRRSGPMAGRAVARVCGLGPARCTIRPVRRRLAGRLHERLVRWQPGYVPLARISREEGMRARTNVEYLPWTIAGMALARPGAGGPGLAHPPARGAGAAAGAQGQPGRPREPDAGGARGLLGVRAERRPGRDRPGLPGLRRTGARRPGGGRAGSRGARPAPRPGWPRSRARAPRPVLRGLLQARAHRPGGPRHSRSRTRTSRPMPWPTDPPRTRLKEMDTALSRLAEHHATSPGATPVLLLASRARVGVLHIQVLLPPHIAEESNQKMDALEASMTAEERQVAGHRATRGTPLALDGPGPGAGASSLRHLHRAQVPHPGPLPREHQRGVAGPVPQPAAKGDGALRGGLERAATGHPGGAGPGCDLRPPSQPDPVRPVTAPRPPPSRPPSPGRAPTPPGWPSGPPAGPRAAPRRDPAPADPAPRRRPIALQRGAGCARVEPLPSSSRRSPARVRCPLFPPASCPHP